MQTLTEIRALLEDAGLTPHKRFGQNFLFEQNLMDKVLDLADVQPGQVVLEVGPGTGSLTEELLARVGEAGRVVSAEIDRGLCRLLEGRLGARPNFTLICGDALAGKHAIEPRILEALGPRADLVANLPYNIATPLVAQCLLDSWAVLRGGAAGGVLFSRMTFTIQQEVAQRLVAGPQSGSYGPVSVIVALLGRAQMGPVVPAAAFWPRPTVVSRIVRVDFDATAAAQLRDAGTLKALLATVFGQRRKQLGSVIHRKNAPFATDAFEAAIAKAGIPPTVRGETLTPAHYLAIANSLADAGHAPTGPVELEE